MFGLLISALFPFLGVPITLVATPAMVRATRIYWREHRASGQPDWTDWCGIFFASLAVVLPVSLVGGITFCCVCTFTASASNEVGLYFLEGTGDGSGLWCTLQCTLASPPDCWRRYSCSSN
jgi:hypothetical protein